MPLPSQRSYYIVVHVITNCAINGIISLAQMMLSYDFSLSLLSLRLLILSLVVSWSWYQVFPYHECWYHLHPLQWYHCQYHSCHYCHHYNSCHEYHYCYLINVIAIVHCSHHHPHYFRFLYHHNYYYHFYIIAHDIITRSPSLSFLWIFLIFVCCINSGRTITEKNKL